MAARRVQRGGTSDAARDSRAADFEVEMTDVELRRAQTAYRGSLESGRAWRSFTTNTRHHDMTYWTLIATLFAEPGINRMTLIDRIVAFAGVSRSTAERAVREARASGYIVDRPAGKEVQHFLSPTMLRHCIDYFRNYMDLEKIIRNLGYAP
jgi:hypothetical protein